MASIAIANVIHTERLPIDAQDVVTRVRLVVAGNRGGREPSEFFVRGSDTSPEPGTIVTYFPDPIVYEYVAPEHAVYGATRSFALPEGYNPFLAPNDPLVPDWSGVLNITDASAIKDADPETFATVTSPGDYAEILYPRSPLVYGAKIRYRARSTTSNVSQLTVLLNREAGYISWATYRLETFESVASGEEIDELYAVIPHDARNRAVNTPTVATSGPAEQRVAIFLTETTENVRIHEFYPLILNEALLEQVARAQVRLPASVPQRVTVLGYVPPDREHTIVGWPGGDFTAPVAQHQYELGRTVIDFEQAGSPIGLPAEAIEGARERVVAVDSTVSTRGYPVKMAGRQ